MYKHKRSTKKGNPIPGFENYTITTSGLVFNSTGHELKTHFRGSRSGSYASVTLYKKGRPYKKMIHRLVAETYIPKIKNKDQVNHIDKDKLNNSIANLEWVSCRENNLHKHRYIK